MRVPESDDMSIRLVVEPDVADLRLAGTLDVLTAPVLEGVVDALRGRDVAMDFADLTLMDGAAWLALMDLERRVSERGRRLTVVNVPWRIRKMFEATQTEYLLAELA